MSEDVDLIEIDPTFNRTIEELKFRYLKKESPQTASFNRTIEELKFARKELNDLRKYTF